MDAVDGGLDAVEGFEHLNLLPLQVQDLVGLGGELVGVFLVVLRDDGELVGVVLGMQGNDGVDLVAAIGADLQDYALDGGEAGQAEVEEDKRVQVPGDGCALQRDPHCDPYGDEAQRDPGAEPVFEPVGCLLAERGLLGANRGVPVPQPGAWPYHCRVTPSASGESGYGGTAAGLAVPPRARAAATRPYSGRGQHIGSRPAPSR